ncbi:MAG: dihydrofolate reductase [Hyphomicrobiaceae bacterium]
MPESRQPDRAPDRATAPRAAIVVAVAENGVIGQNGGLPWHLEHDLRMFRQLTLDKPVVMGRKTYDAIGRPLDRRLNIVISRQSILPDETVKIARSPDDALDKAYRAAREMRCDEFLIIGGAEIFAATLAHVERIYLTRVRARPDGDTLFPHLVPDEWREMSRDPLPKGARDDYEAVLIVYNRIKKGQSMA